MTRRYHTTGQNNWQPRNPSGLTREHVHGPLVPGKEGLGERLAMLAIRYGCVVFLMALAFALGRMA
jgi:hypothetical protein